MPDNLDEYVLEKDYYNGNTHIRVFAPKMTPEEREEKIKITLQFIADLLD